MPANLRMIESQAVTFLAEGDLAGARAVIRAAPKALDPTSLVAFFANYQDPRLGPRRESTRPASASDAGRLRRRPRSLGGLPGAGLRAEERRGERARACRGDAQGLREAASPAPEDGQRHVMQGVSRTWDARTRRSGRGCGALLSGRFPGMLFSVLTSSTSSCASTCSPASMRRRSTSSSRCSRSRITLARRAEDRPQLRPAPQQPEVPEARGPRNNPAGVSFCSRPALRRR
jgi:hypothetical protein